MPDIKTVLLLFGIVFLLMVAIRKVLRKQHAQASKPVRSVRSPQVAAPSPRMTEEQFKKVWKSLSYLMLAAAAGNLYMVYNAVQGALRTQSYILWIDSVFSLTAAVIAVIIWRGHSRNLIIAYMVITVLPIMFFMSTSHPLDGLIRLFPLVLVYFVIQPVWEYLSSQEHNTGFGKENEQP